MSPDVSPGSWPARADAGSLVQVTGQRSAYRSHSGAISAPWCSTSRLTSAYGCVGRRWASSGAGRTVPGSSGARLNMPVTARFRCSAQGVPSGPGAASGSLRPPPLTGADDGELVRQDGRSCAGGATTAQDEATPRRQRVLGVDAARAWPCWACSACTSPRPCAATARPATRISSSPDTHWRPSSSSPASVSPSPPVADRLRGADAGQTAEPPPHWRCGAAHRSSRPGPQPHGPTGGRDPAVLRGDVRPGHPLGPPCVADADRAERGPRGGGAYGGPRVVRPRPAGRRAHTHVAAPPLHRHRSPAGERFLPGGGVHGVPVRRGCSRPAGPLLLCALPPGSPAAARRWARGLARLRRAAAAARRTGRPARGSTPRPDRAAGPQRDPVGSRRHADVVVAG